MASVQELCKKVLCSRWPKGKNCTTKVFRLKGQDPTMFIKERLSTFWPNYHQHNSASHIRNTSQYRCDRSGKKTKGSYVRVGCNAYISYKVDKCPTLGDVVLERAYDVHNNHLPDSPDDMHLKRTSPQLEQKVLEWIEMGCQTDIIVIKAYEWAVNEGHHNLHDARYFLTPDDVKNIRKKSVRATRLDEQDSISLHEIVTNQRRQDVLYYQQYIQDEQALILVLQTDDMRADMRSSPANMIFLDATNSVNKYGFPLWSLVATNKFGRGVPIAHIITSSETKETLQVALEALRDAGLNPRAFMTDKDYREILAVQAVFKEADLLLCYFHMLQAVHRWMSSRNSSLCGTGHGLKRDLVIQYFARLKQCSSKDEFDNVCQEFEDEFADHADLVEYFEGNWRPIGKMWAAFGRQFNHNNADTNNLAERFFLRLKHQFLGKRRNRRLDDLVNLLLTKVPNYFTILHNLREVGRIKDHNKVPLALAPAAAAKRMVNKGWHEKVINLGDGNYIIESEYDFDRRYCVNIPDISCTCPASEAGGMCKHVHVVRQLQQQNHPSFGSLEVDLASGCEFLRPHANNIWNVEEGEEGERYLVFNMLDTDIPIKATLNSCSCAAFSVFSDCSHIILAKSVLHHEVRERPTVDDLQQSGDEHNKDDVEVPEENGVISMLDALLHHYATANTVPDKYTCSLIKKAHDHTFIKDKGDRRRKHTPLHPWRIGRIKPQAQSSHSDNSSRPTNEEQNKATTALEDHNMSKHPNKRKNPPLKTSFGPPSKKVTISKTTTPSMKTIKARNLRQTGLLSIADMKVNQLAFDKINGISEVPPCDHEVEGIFYADLVVVLRCMSTDTLKGLSAKVISANLKKFLHAKLSNNAPSSKRKKGGQEK